MKLIQPYYIEPRKECCHISLNGEWDLAWTDDPEDTPEFRMKADVPGTVYRQLADAGVLPEPYFGTNGEKYDWVDDKTWFYRKEFSLDEIPAGKKIILCMDGVCYYSRIWLNGVLLGDHEGMFGGPVCDVTQIARQGQNVLKAAVRACNWHMPGFNSRNPDKEKPFPIIPWYLMRDTDSLPGDYNVIGIWRDVRIEVLNDTHLSRPYLQTTAIGDGCAELTFEAEITDPAIDEFACCPSVSEGGGMTFSLRNNYGLRQDRKLEVLLEMTDKQTGNIIYSEPEEYIPFDWEKSGTDIRYYECHHYTRRFTIKDPVLWYPHTMGRPGLYRVRILLMEDGNTLDEQEFDFGIRSIDRVYSAGDRFRTRWDRFWFVINGERVFLKGVNWMPIDLFLCLKEEEYRWTLEAARDMGVMLIRVWSGGGIPESDVFYSLCDEMGIMVWQDHSLANSTTPNIDHDVLLCQEFMNLYRLRNHPSLAIHCGGNEFNPYDKGNLASMSVIENAVHDLDPQRQWVRTTPDRGSAHIYQDMEPVRYRRIAKQIPFVAESGIHSFPSYKAISRVVSEEELSKPLSDIFSREFETQNPELRKHFAEFNPGRIPRMLSLASAITGIRGIDLPELTEATHIASFAFYQIMAESLRENYPVTTGLMPWVFRRPSVAVGIQLMDGFGQPIAPYYALKNAYAPLSISLAADELSYYPGESVPLNVCILNDTGKECRGLELSVRIYTPGMELAEMRRSVVDISPDPVPQKISFGEFRLGNGYTDRYFFIVLSLSNGNGLVNRKVYWPRCLSVLGDEQFREKRRLGTCENMFMEKGPWLKDQVSSVGKASLELEVISQTLTKERHTLEVSVKNRGSVPAFPVMIDGENLASVASDNCFLLLPGEVKSIRISFFRRNGDDIEKTIKARAWNSAEIKLDI